MIKFSPRNPDSAVERIDFYQDDQKITLCNRYDTFAVFVDDEDDSYEAYDWKDYDADTGMETGTELGWVDEEAGEVVESWVEGSIDDDQKQVIIDAFDTGLEGAVQALGWQWSDREVWFYGAIDQIDSGALDESEGGHLD